ncbi:HAMP domain-containing sensor histidine kinase [Thalassotalea sp. PP2-459]|uniref:sensor histidine kinase n=1 Tax=Thalassotalea sp. PP2-459 TaxID=1742724 RepID=UPI000945754C|nr:HAMP domain-containing sensor histidine kinase [Thalassotalea sp. PP2-459]OKY24781.1 hypothetical protein BI291_04980 [Thalassotalea sp. PP2-459]
MSLRGYLFLLIGGLITLLTLIQLVLVYWIEKNIAKEVDLKARQYSEQVIELAVEQINDQPTNFIVETPKDSTHTWQVEQKVITTDAENTNVKVYRFEDKKVIDITTEPTSKPKSPNNSKKTHQENETQVHINKKILKKEFKTIIDNIHQQNIDRQSKSPDNLKTFIVKSPNVHQQTWVSTSRISDSSKALFEKIQLMLIVVAIIGLLFAFWLSSQFNKPLRLLTKGFKHLSQGDYKHHVPQVGIKEIRTTIAHFNELVQRLEQLSKAEQQNKELTHLAELGEVSRGLAHALRNPIHTIGLSIEQLEDDSLDVDHKHKLLATIQHKIQHLDKSIKALLTLTANGISRDENVPVLAVIQDIILEYKSTIQKTIDFTLNVQENLTIKGAESEIRSILHTLINNACEASKSGDNVTIDAQNGEQGIEITVKDCGVGLTSHIKQQLFQPHISTKPEGAGMGLYIANRLITLHYQGNLTLTNNQKIGCTACAVFGV